MKKNEQDIDGHYNSMQENLKMCISNDIKNINITKTAKLDVIGKSNYKTPI